jgi:hypothetical protein
MKIMTSKDLNSVLVELVAENNLICERLGVSLVILIGFSSTVNNVSFNPPDSKNVRLTGVTIIDDLAHFTLADGKRYNSYDLSPRGIETIHMVSVHPLANRHQYVPEFFDKAELMALFNSMLVSKKKYSI